MQVEQILSELEEVKQEIFRRKVKNFQIAEHPSRFKGSGFEIHTTNQWRLGEPMTNIDWNLSLRTWPKEIYKTDRVETKNAPTILVADISPSVFVEIDRQANRFKLLLHLVGALGLAANYFHDPVGILAFSEGVEFYLRPKPGRGQIFYGAGLLLEKAEEFDCFVRLGHRFKDRYPSAGGRQGGGINSALEMLAGTLRRRQCSIVLLSDFTDAINGESEIDFKIIETLSSVHNWNVVAIFLDDPLEFDWKNSWGIVSVRNSETGRIERIKASQARQIKEKFCQEREVLRRRFGQVGVDSTVLSFGDHFNQLAQFLSQRSARLF